MSALAALLGLGILVIVSYLSSIGADSANEYKQDDDDNWWL